MVHLQLHPRFGETHLGVRVEYSDFSVKGLTRTPAYLLESSREGGQVRGRQASPLHESRPAKVEGKNAPHRITKRAEGMGGWG